MNYSTIPSVNELAHEPLLNERQLAALDANTQTLVDMRLNELTTLNQLFEYVDADDLYATMPKALQDALMAHIKADERLIDTLNDEVSS